jgi:hypothetical protein
MSPDLRIDDRTLILPRLQGVIRKLKEILEYFIVVIDASSGLLIRCCDKIPGVITTTCHKGHRLFLGQIVSEST